VTLDEIRAELPVLERFAYLNAGTFGPLPRRTVEAQQAWENRALVEGRAGRAFFTEVIEDRARLRAALGELVGAAPESVALTTSTSEACNIVAAGLRLAPGDEVVTTDAEHPGLLSPLATWGADVRVGAVSQAPASEALRLLEEQITPRTKLVAISHVAWTTGQVLPVAELAGRHFPLLVDGAQAADRVFADVNAAVDAASGVDA